MAGENDPSLTETPEGRIVVLFMAFVAITYLFDKLTEWVDHYLEHHNRRGLLHTIHKLEEELLALGLISLILIALEVSVVSGQLWTPWYERCCYRVNNDLSSSGTLLLPLESSDFTRSSGCVHSSKSGTLVRWPLLPRMGSARRVRSLMLEGFRCWQTRTQTLLWVSFLGSLFAGL